MEWFFDGIGTELVSLIIGLVVGGGTGYKIAISKKSIKQKQKAGDNSSQTQIGEVNNGGQTKSG